MESKSIAETVARLASHETPLSNQDLVNLSGLDHDEEVLLEQVWETIDVERRRQIIERLVKLVEDNFELNYDNIFRHCLRDTDAEVRRWAIEGLW